MLRADPAAMAAALERVAREDAAVVPLLTPAECRELIHAGADLCVPLREAGHRRGRARRLSGFRYLPLDSGAASALAADSRGGAPHRRRARRIMAQPPLETLPLNDLVLQRYPPGARGITPHRDHVRYVGLVVIVQMSGDGRFGLCADRSGAGARVLDAGPGDGILMRAPGFGGAKDRPFHFLDGITVERYSLGMRSDRTAEPAAG